MDEPNSSALDYESDEEAQDEAPMPIKRPRKAWPTVPPSKRVNTRRDYTQGVDANISANSVKKKLSVKQMKALAKLADEYMPLSSMKALKYLTTLGH